MFKKVLFLCLSLNLLLLNGCIKSTSTSQTNSLDQNESSTLLLPLPTQATDIKLSFQYSPYSQVGVSDPLCYLPVINQEQYSGDITQSISNSCLNNGDYSVTLNLRLNGKRYAGMDYIHTRDNEGIIHNGYIEFRIILQSSDDDELVIESQEKADQKQESSLNIGHSLIPSGYEYVGEKTINGETIHILHLKKSKDVCTVSSQCRELQKGDGLSPKPVCGGATLQNYNKFVFEYACGSSM